MGSSPRVARLGTFTFFALDGFLLGLWIVHIPAVEQQTGVSHPVLGWLLLLLGGGAFAGMRLVGRLTDRFGARTVVRASAVLCSATLVLPGLAVNGWGLGLALLVFGLGNGCLDVSMNAHAVQVERAYQRPIMSAFHAVFSIGGVLAALVGARTLSWGWSPAVTLTTFGGAGLVVTALAARTLLPPDARAVASDPSPVRKTTVAPRIWAFAALALLIMLSEGTANDWSVLEARDILDAPAAVAALAYGAFATAMTVGRLLTDRAAARFGPVAIVRYGGFLAAAALTTVALSPWVGLTLVGWALFGLGLSGCVPQLFSAAGHADPAAAGANVSRVAGLGYLGMLAGPAIIGPLTTLVPLNLTFLLPVAFCAAAGAAARILRPGPPVPTLSPAEADSSPPRPASVDPR